MKKSSLSLAAAPVVYMCGSITNSMNCWEITTTTEKFYCQLLIWVELVCLLIIDTSCYFVNQKLPGSHVWYYHVNFIGWYYISISVLKKSWFRFQSSIYVADNFICCMKNSFLILSFHVLLSSILACNNSRTIFSLIMDAK